MGLSQDCDLPSAPYCAQYPAHTIQWRAVGHEFGPHPP